MKAHSNDKLTDVFALVIEDRHSDTGVEVWTDREAAIARAKALATEYAAYNGGPVEERPIQGWEYYACYSCENDSVRVVKVKLQSPNDKLMDAPPKTPESNDAQSARSHAAHG